MKDELNVNMSGCIVERGNIGNIEYINICTGETNKVEWGLGKWSAFGVIAIVIIGLIIMIGILIKSVLFDF